MNLKQALSLLKIGKRRQERELPMLLNISSYYFSFVLFITYNNLYYLLKKRITAIANIMQKEVGVINKTLNLNIKMLFAVMDKKYNA